MAIKTVFIHIGPPKTGTTSIQRFLIDARSELLDRGILYPDSGRPKPGESFHIQRANRTRKESAGITHRLLALSLDGRIEGVNADEIWGPLITELSDSSATRAVISSERFSMLTLPQVREVQRRLSGYKVLIVSYVREPFSKILSDYAQRLKVGSIDEPFGVFIKREDRLLQNYDAFVLRWQEVFGDENVLIRSFDRARKNDGLEMDFAKLITDDPEPLRSYVSTRKMNRSPGPGVLHTLRLLNRCESRLGRRASLFRAFDAARKIVLTARILTEPVGKLIWGSNVYTESERSWVRSVAASGYAERMQHAKATEREINSCAR